MKRKQKWHFLIHSSQQKVDFWKNDQKFWAAIPELVMI